MGRQGRYIISTECRRERRRLVPRMQFVRGGGREEGEVGGGEEKVGGGVQLAFVFCGGVAGPSGTEVSERRWSVRVRGSECYTVKKRRSETFLVRCLPLIAVLRTR